MNFLYFVFVSLIWVSTQGGFSVLAETTETENTDPTTEQITEEKAREICEGMLSCRSDTKAFEDEKYLCNWPAKEHYCLDKCLEIVQTQDNPTIPKCDDTACIMGKLESDCRCDKKHYAFGFSCEVTDKALTPQEQETAFKNICQKMDSCGKNPICFKTLCLCSRSDKSEDCQDRCRNNPWNKFSFNVFIQDLGKSKCLCEKGYSTDDRVKCKVTEAPPVVTTTTTTEDDGIQEGWKTETNIEWLLSSLKNMQYAAWHIFKDEGFGRYGGRGGYDGYDRYGRHGVKSQDQQEETADSPSTATENDHGEQGNDRYENHNNGDSDSDGESHD